MCVFSLLFSFSVAIANNWYQMALNLGAKFEVGKFDGTGNFGLWQRRVKDLLAQQGFLKALRESKPKDMEDIDWLMRSFIM